MVCQGTLHLPLRRSMIKLKGKMEVDHTALQSPHLWEKRLLRVSKRISLNGWRIPLEKKWIPVTSWVPWKWKFAPPYRTAWAVLPPDWGCQTRQQRMARRRHLQTLSHRASRMTVCHQTTPLVKSKGEERGRFAAHEMRLKWSMAMIMACNNWQRPVKMSQKIPRRR